MSRKKVKEEIEKSESRKKVVRTFRRAGFDVTYMRDGKWTSDVSIMYLKPNEDIAQILGSSLEVVALLAEFPDFDARSVEEVREEVDTGSGEVRLSTEVAFVVTEDENTGEEVREINKRYRNLHTQLVGFSLSEIERCKPYGSEDFIRNLQLRFYSRDLYQPRGPVLSPVNFFGREEMVSELTSELRSGTGHVGVFGLRKMGKTSLLYRLVDTLRRDAKVAHAHIDLQRVVAVNPSPEYLLWTIAEKLLDENQFLQDKVDYRLFGEYSLFSDIQEKENVFESFSHDINRLIKSQDRIKFVFMLDEIELLSHNVESAPWEGEDFVRFWRFLRGMDQENPGRFSYFVTGTNPSAIEDNKIVLEEEGYGSKKSIDNPTYNYFTKKYLPPLTSQENGNGECGELLNDLGHRMGLVWSEEAIDQLAEYVGGHPSLLRHYASMVHNKLSPRSQKERVDADLVRSLAPDFIRNRESDFSQMTDVLREQYEDEYFLLQLAAEGRVGEFREWAKASPEDVAHLRGYGLIEDHLAGVGFKIDLLQTWFQQRQQPSGSNRSSEAKPIGERIGGYEIKESIGHSGGFGEVYKARVLKDGEDREGQVALKILNGGSISALQREVDALSDVHHPYIVELLNHGQTATGDLYIAMEFLQGNTLRDYCQKATRLPEKEVCEIGRKLLDALTALHPDKEKADKLKQKGELTEKELRDREKARHGYIHRDIKPENVVYVPGRGPVLIDFGISSRVLDRIDTQKSTPGYLPPDVMNNPKWTEDVDLYQLGLTLLQVATGVRYRTENGGRNLDDLHILADEELDEPLRSALLTMTADSEAERFDTAREAYRALSRS